MGKPPAIGGTLALTYKEKKKGWRSEKKGKIGMFYFCYWVWNPVVNPNTMNQSLLYSFRLLFMCKNTYNGAASVVCPHS